VALTAVEVGSLDPATYVPHALHLDQRTWSESNCYVDLWIEVLHWLGLEPLASLAFTLGIDFEGDQWTFIKPPLSDLKALFGVNVQELNVWRPLVQHVLEQVTLGRLVVSEVDAYFLPDTLGTTYRTEHAKTSIAIRAIDLEERQLGYFHATGYHVLAGTDFDGVFRLGEEWHDWLAPYVELVKLNGVQRSPLDELVTRSTHLLRAHATGMPGVNPFARYQSRFEADLAWLGREGMIAFHGYAFASLRQLGASSELAATYLRWLAGHNQLDLDPAATEFEAIATGARSLQLKAARAANGRSAGDWQTLLRAMASAWCKVHQHLACVFGQPAAPSHTSGLL
jgi:hypothetical protein